MATTDQTALVEVQAVLQEDASFSNGLWTLAEVLTAFNQRQYRFLCETGLLAGTAILGWTGGVEELPLPPDWIATICAAWHDLAANRWTPLERSNRFEQDHVASPEAVVTVATPQGYRDQDTLGTLMLGIYPAPQAVGEVELWYVPLSEVLDGQGQLFAVPDDWVPYLIYGVYADLLSKDGRGQDLLRARYAEVRYEEGIALAQALLTGWD